MHLTWLRLDPELSIQPGAAWRSIKQTEREDVRGRRDVLRSRTAYSLARADQSVDDDIEHWSPDRGAWGNVGERARGRGRTRYVPLSSDIVWSEDSNIPTARAASVRHGSAVGLVRPPTGSRSLCRAERSHAVQYWTETASASQARRAVSSRSKTSSTSTDIPFLRATTVEPQQAQSPEAIR